MENVNEPTSIHLFAGGGGGLLADLITGHNPICAVEWEPAACEVLRERAAEGWFPDLYVYEGDVRLFDPSEYSGRIHTLCAGFPCQDISVAGKQAGVGEGTRSGLYREVLRIADAVRPEYIFMENVSAIVSMREKFSIIIIEKLIQFGLFGSENSESWAGRYVRRIVQVTGQAAIGYVLADLSARGYSARWLCLRASDVGANHHRDRWWMLAKRKNANSYVQHGEWRSEPQFSASVSGESWDKSERLCGAGNVRHSQHAGQPSTEVTGSIAQGSDHHTTRAQQTEQPARSSEQFGELETRANLQRDVAKPDNCGYSDGQAKVYTAEGRLDALGESGTSGANVADPISIGQPGQGKYLNTRHTATDRCGETGNAIHKRERPEWQAQSALRGVDDVFSAGLVQGWYESEPNIGRVTDENNNRAAQLKMLGNAQHPLQAAVARKMLEGMF